ncbi:MAG: [protein-PII] uridylyltransferase [Ferrovum sp.]|nr:[protein-PII] uridylyltransferase [Ferrovum sp.]
MLPISGAALKTHLQQVRQTLYQDYLAHPNPQRLLKCWQRTVDQVLTELWHSHRCNRDNALVAVGGYGRGELYPYSDIDVLLLLPHPADAPTIRHIEQFISALWDGGLEVGHSVRTVEDCLTEARGDLTIATALAEMRPLAGPRILPQRLTQSLRQSLDLSAFKIGKVAEQRQRHKKHHNTAFNLEPNLKDGPGGLRDLHTIFWLAWGSGLKPGWTALSQAGLITPREVVRARQQRHFLQDLRIRLHGLAQRREDRLLFDYQTALARQMNFQDSFRRRASEALMQTYYKTAQSVLLLNTILLEQLNQPEIIPSPIALAPPFMRQGELLGTEPENLLATDPNLLFEGFLLLQHHPDLRGFTPAALRAVWRGKGQIDAAFRANPLHQQKFLEILRQPARTADVLRRMNYYGILGRYIPAFGRIVGQMQHDLYHVYTVDEHTLRVVRNLRRFALPRYDHEFPLCAQLMQGFDRPDLLYLAALFHDIAKGRGGNHAQLGRSDALYFCRQHRLPRQDTQFVAWLVEQHLNLSAVAQKQDLSDPEIIQNFARTVGDMRRLTALYLLTVADICGTSPMVWNAWKGKLLEDLYRLTSQYLCGQPPNSASATESRQQEALAILKHYGLTQITDVALWKTVETAYFHRHEIQDIAWHARSLQGRVGSPQTIVRARLSPVGEGFQVLIYSPDRQGLFAHICAYFDRAGQAVMAARIHTTLDQHALDTFQILPRHGITDHYRTTLKRLESELQERLHHWAPLPPPLKSRLPRQLKHFPFQSRILLGEQERDGTRPLTLITGDRPGLLYRLACVFLRHNIDLKGARINTLGERVEDVFLIAAEPLLDPVVQNRLRDDLLKELNQEFQPT